MEPCKAWPKKGLPFQQRNGAPHVAPRFWAFEAGVRVAIVRPFTIAHVLHVLPERGSLRDEKFKNWTFSQAQTPHFATF